MQQRVFIRIGDQGRCSRCPISIRVGVPYLIRTIYDRSSERVVCGLAFNENGGRSQAPDTIISTIGKDSRAI